MQEYLVHVVGAGFRQKPPVLHEPLEAGTPFPKHADRGVDAERVRIEVRPYGLPVKQSLGQSR